MISQANNIFKVLFNIKEDVRYYSKKISKELNGL